VATKQEGAEGKMLHGGKICATKPIRAFASLAADYVKELGKTWRAKKESVLTFNLERV